MTWKNTTDILDFTASFCEKKRRGTSWLRTTGSQLFLSLHMSPRYDTFEAWKTDASHAGRWHLFSVHPMVTAQKGETSGQVLVGARISFFFLVRQH